MAITLNVVNLGQILANVANMLVYVGWSIERIHLSIIVSIYRHHFDIMLAKSQPLGNQVSRTCGHREPFLIPFFDQQTNVARPAAALHTTNHHLVVSVYWNKEFIVWIWSLIKTAILSHPSMCEWIWMFIINGTRSITNRSMIHTISYPYLQIEACPNSFWNRPS